MSILKKIKQHQQPDTSLSNVMEIAQRQMQDEAWKKLQPQIDSAKTEASSANQRAASAETEKAAAVKRAEKAEGEVTELRAKVKALEDSNTQKLNQIQLEASTAQQIRDKATAREDSLRTKLEQAQQEAERLKVQVAELQGKLSAKPKVVEKIKTVTTPAPKTEVPEFEAIPVRGPGGIERVKIRPVRAN